MPEATTRPFRPGFRLSALDVLVLLAGAAAAAYTMTVDRWLAVAIAFVVGHFFLFCNVLRMSRALELIWAGVFVALAACAMTTGAIGWPVVFVVSTGVTIILSAIELRRPSYHGVGWRTVNPGLPEWWNARAARLTPPTP
ncbi:MAG TPA: hypothetical protein VEA69_07515 [Tepidisphaeraceae bacterium]|nr:hypothetical protein [Tepidisphaeraceae bacterium]